MIGIPTAAVNEVPPTTRAIWNDVLGYWERRRLIYNGLLAVVFVTFMLEHDWWAIRFSPEMAAELVVLVAAANLCYTTAHLVDMALQHSDFRTSWRERRGWLFACGCLLGAALTRLTLLFLVTNGGFVFK